MKTLQRIAPACVCALAMLVACAYLPARSFAHAIALKSSLAARTIKRGIAGSISLYFNSRIEVKLSRASLRSADQPERSLVMLAGQSPGEVVVQLPALEPGEYAVRYRVLAADGHVTEDTLPFSVAP